MEAITCKVCERGSLFPQKVYRMSPPVVAIGYILLIPSVLGVLASLGFMVFSWATAGAVLSDSDGISAATAQVLRDEDVPDDVVTELENGRSVTEAELAKLSPGQRAAVEAANAQLLGATAGAGCAAACGTTLAMVGAVLSFVGGLVGWLLIMKKNALVCNSCGASVATA